MVPSPPGSANRADLGVPLSPSLSSPLGGAQSQGAPRAGWGRGWHRRREGNRGLAVLHPTEVGAGKVAPLTHIHP